MPVAQESQRSASFAPRRASENERRIVAPFPSSTSRPHLSHTRTVLRANCHSFVPVIWRIQPTRKRNRIDVWIRRKNQQRAFPYFAAFQPGLRESRHGHF